VRTVQKNRIVVFNRITDNRLQDVEFFEDLLENHYQKFTYGYNMIAENDILDQVDDIECECGKHKLTFLVKFTKKVTKTVLEQINGSAETVFGSQKFDALTSIDGKTLTIEITKKKPVA
jgi:hypothetical protein